MAAPLRPCQGGWFGRPFPTLLRTQWDERSPCSSSVACSGRTSACRRGREGCRSRPWRLAQGCSRGSAGCWCQQGEGCGVRQCLGATGVPRGPGHTDPCRPLSSTTAGRPRAAGWALPVVSAPLGPPGPPGAVAACEHPWVSPGCSPRGRAGPSTRVRCHQGQERKNKRGEAGGPQGRWHRRGGSAALGPCLRCPRPSARRSAPCSSPASTSSATSSSPASRSTRTLRQVGGRELPEPGGRRQPRSASPGLVPPSLSASPGSPGPTTAGVAVASVAAGPVPGCHGSGAEPRPPGIAWAAPGEGGGWGAGRERCSGQPCRPQPP